MTPAGIAVTVTYLVYSVNLRVSLCGVQLSLGCEEVAGWGLAGCLCDAGLRGSDGSTVCRWTQESHRSRLCQPAQVRRRHGDDHDDIPRPKIPLTLTLFNTGETSTNSWRLLAELTPIGPNPLHQFPRSKSVTSWQQVGNFPVYGETCLMDLGHMPV